MYVFTSQSPVWSVHSVVSALRLLPCCKYGLRLAGRVWLVVTYDMAADRQV